MMSPVRERDSGVANHFQDDDNHDTYGELSRAKDRSSFKSRIVDLNLIFLPSHFSAISSFFSVLMAEKCAGRKMKSIERGFQCSAR
jgi:hypothetical protein